MEGKQTVLSWRKVLPAGLAALVLAAAAGTSRAQVNPGDTIAAGNVSAVRDLVSPGVYWKLTQGLGMKIAPTKRIDWPPPYKEATERWSGQVRLATDNRSLVGYAAGLPFPSIDANDRDVATKIIWNSVFRPMMGDDYDLRYYVCDTAYSGRGGKAEPVDHFEIGHYAGYNLVGRTEVQPLPIDPDFRDSGRSWLFALYPVLAPPQHRGVGFIRYRYADANKVDDGWGWSAGTRRVRRLSQSMFSSGDTSNTAAFSWDPDHCSGFNAKTELYDYRFIGQKQMLASVNGDHPAEIRPSADGVGSSPIDGWQLRQLYVVEASPRGNLAEFGAIESKTVIYVDAEMWFEPYIDSYDRMGQLFKNRIYWFSHCDRAVPDARVAIYPFRRLFLAGALSTDVQSGRSAMCYLPGLETQERECWYINMGAVDKNFFTTAAMVNAAR